MKHDAAKETRRRMAPDERREAILDAAQALFMRRGYEDVTIADVLRSAGISKGGFYHHFAAKEDLLTGIVSRMADQGLAVAEAARSRTDGTALDRLNAFLMSSLRWKADNIEALRTFANVLLRPGNDILFQRAFKANAKVVAPILEDMIRDGVRGRIFDVADPRLTAEVIVGFSQGRQATLVDAIAMAADGRLDEATDRLSARMQAEGAICDRLLGLPQGSVTLSSPADLRRMLVGLAGRNEREA